MKNSFCDDLEGDFMGADEEFQNEDDSCNIVSKLYNDGYRIGKIQEEEKRMQLGFDGGFQRGMEMGRICGIFYGYCRTALALKSKEIEEKKIIKENNFISINVINNNYTNIYKRLNEIIFEIIPESCIDSQCFSSINQEHFNELKDIITTISPELEKDYEDFLLKIKENISSK
jgi:hypothetical protein